MGNAYITAILLYFTLCNGRYNVTFTVIILIIPSKYVIVVVMQWIEIDSNN